MMTCKEVSTELSRGDWQSQPWTRRLAGRLHLAMCRHCRTFRRQLEAIGLAGRHVSTRAERECPPVLEQKILERLRQRPE